MTVMARPMRWLRQARRREAGIALVTSLPLLAAMGFILWRSFGTFAAGVFVATALLLLGIILQRRLKNRDEAWLIKRLDTLAGGFAAGLKPTGNKDPFALRRNALGLARTLLEGGFDLRLDQLLGKAYLNVYEYCMTSAEQQAAAEAISDKPGFWKKWLAELEALKGDDHADRYLEIQQFILDRLRGYFADKGYSERHFDAVNAVALESLPDFAKRLAAIAEFAGMPEAEALAAAKPTATDALLTELVNQWVAGIERLRWPGMEMPVRVASTSATPVEPAGKLGAKKVAAILLCQKLGKVHVGLGHRGLRVVRG